MSCGSGRSWACIAPCLFPNGNSRSLGRTWTTTLYSPPAEEPHARSIGVYISVITPDKRVLTERVTGRSLEWGSNHRSPGAGGSLLEAYGLPFAPSSALKHLRLLRYSLMSLAPTSADEWLPILPKILDGARTTNYANLAAWILLVWDQRKFSTIIHCTQYHSDSRSNLL